MYGGYFNSSSRKPGIGVNAPINTDGKTALHLAIEAGDSDAAVKLLKIGANPNQQDGSGKTPLFDAISKQNIDLVELLLEKGATFRVKDDTDATPLDFAIEQKCAIEFIHQLKKLGAQLTIPQDDNKTSLHVAAIAGRADLIEYLAQSGLPLDQKDKDGKTALHLATEKGQHMVMIKLIELGADATTRDENIKTPLHHAAEQKDEIAVDILLAEQSVRRTINKYKSYGEGYTPLLAAASSGHASIVEKIAAVGGDVNQIDLQNRHSLFIAVEYGHLECVRSLIALGAETGKSRKSTSNESYITHWINNDHYNEILIELHKAGVSLDLQDGSGFTALHKAADYNDTNKVKALLNLGANPNITNEFGKRPLDLIMDNYTYAFNDHIDLLSLLLKKGADANISPVADMRQAPLHLAAQHGRTPMVQLLLQHKAIIDQRERNGTNMTPFLTAAYFGHFESGMALANAGANTQIKDTLGRNGLHLAAEGGSLEFVSYMLDTAKLDIHAKDHNGATALHAATALEKTTIINLLLEKGADPMLPDNKGWTALHHAANRDSAALLDIFTQGVKGKNINWNAPTQFGDETPLHIAVSNGQDNATTKLLELGANPMLADKNGLIPLHLAILHDREELAKTLLTAMTTAKVDIAAIRENNGWFLPHFAATRDNTEFMIQLANAGCDMTAPTTTGDTPLHIAARMGKTAVLAYLVHQQGVDIGVRNSAGLLPLELAMQSKNKEAFDILSKAHILRGDMPQLPTAKPAAGIKPRKP